MARFLFRAQAALDLRKRQEEEALRALAAAEAREREADHALRRQIDTLADGMRRGLDEEARPGDTTSRIWYRNWIVGQQQRVERCRQAWQARRADVVAATAEAQRARRKVRTLERFRDRAWRRFTVAERREEQKGFDHLGSLRFALGMTDKGGDT